MALTKQEWIRLEEKADELRKLCLYTTHCSSGHIGGSMSAADVLTALYYKYMNFDPKNPTIPTATDASCPKDTSAFSLRVCSPTSVLSTRRTQNLQPYRQPSRNAP